MLRRRPGRPPNIIGHRGVRGARPENTLAAFELAASLGADGVELDVRVSRDGALVVAHDPDLSRVSGGRDTRAVADVEADELARVELGGGAGVPRLSEVLALARARGLFVNVEMKRDVPDRRAVVRRTLEALREPRFAERVVVSSFDPFMLEAFALGSRVPVALLFHRGQAHLRPWLVARALRVDALHPERTLIGRDLSAAAGRVVNVWTVNDPTEARLLADVGVDGLITDVPGELRAALG
ncbi:MAG: glycerophosphodiester phosphodiesterase [Polyangiaceae bacterium]|nr:glycerophosphodiester phosphodiesterase [Polyangiaceae bacterium]